MKIPKFAVYRDASGQYRWRLTAANGKIVAVGEAYTRKADAWRAVGIVADAAVFAALTADI